MSTAVVPAESHRPVARHEEERLWRRHAAGDRAARDALIAQYLPLARLLALGAKALEMETPRVEFWIGREPRDSRAPDQQPKPDVERRAVEERGAGRGAREPQRIRKAPVLMRIAALRRERRLHDCSF